MGRSRLTGRGLLLEYIGARIIYQSMGEVSPTTPCPKMERQRGHQGAARGAGQIDKREEQANWRSAGEEGKAEKGGWEILLD